MGKTAPTPDNKLVGMKQIAAHLGVSESTVLIWRRDYDKMPLKKLKGQWVSTRSALDKWFASLVE